MTRRTLPLVDTSLDVLFVLLPFALLAATVGVLFVTSVVRLKNGGRGGRVRVAVAPAVVASVVCCGTLAFIVPLYKFSLSCECREGVCEAQCVPAYTPCRLAACQLQKAWTRALNGGGTTVL